MGKFRERKRNRFDPRGKRQAKVEINSPKEPCGLKIIYEKLLNGPDFEHLPNLHCLGAIASDGLEAVTAILQFSGTDAKGSGALVRVLLPFLQHASKDVTLAAVGALRNLSACGSDQHISQLLECGVLPPLYELLIAFSEPAAATRGVEYWDVLEQAAYVIYNICEMSDEATQLTPESVARVLLLHSSAAPYAVPPTLVLATDTALLCCTENNPKVCAVVSPHTPALQAVLSRYTAPGTSPVTASVTAPVTGDDALALLTALTVTGILTNLGEFEQDGPEQSAVLQLCSVALSLPPARLLQQHASVVPSDAGEPPPGSDAPTAPNNSGDAAAAIDGLNSFTLEGEGEVPACSPADDTPASPDDEAETELLLHLQAAGSSQQHDNGALSSLGWVVVQHWLQATQLALELCNNLCCGDDDSSYDSDSPPQLSAGERENGMEEDDDQWEQLNTDNSSVLPSLLVQHDLFSHVLNVLQPPDPAVLHALHGSKYSAQLETLVCGVQGRGLATLQGVVEVLDMAQLGGAERLYQCWTHLARLAFGGDETAAAGVVEGATGAMRAVVSKYTPEDADHLSAITREELQVLFSAGLSCGVSVARRNLARLVGLLGCLLLSRAGTKDPVPDAAKGVLLEATEYLLKLASTDQELFVSAEALDVLIDLYSDDRTDRLAHEAALLPRLLSIQHFFNARHKQAKDREEHRVLYVTVKENLPEFIKYKTPRVNNVDPSKKHASKEGAHKHKSKAKAVTRERRK